MIDENLISECYMASRSNPGNIRESVRAAIQYYEAHRSPSQLPESKDDAWKRQEGGSHYTKLAIQPMQYALVNNLNMAQANVVKYITRYKDKNGLADLRKAIHTIELLIAHDYPADTTEVRETGMQYPTTER